MVERFLDTGRELITLGRVALVRGGLKLKDPKPPVTPGTITDDVSKNKHPEMYVATCNSG